MLFCLYFFLTRILLAVLFTGGSRVGKIVATAAAKHLTPTTLEVTSPSHTQSFFFFSLNIPQLTARRQIPGDRGPEMQREERGAEDPVGPDGERGPSVREPRLRARAPPLPVAPRERAAGGVLRVLPKGPEGVYRPDRLGRAFRAGEEDVGRDGGHGRPWREDGGGGAVHCADDCEECTAGGLVDARVGGDIARIEV